MPKKNQQFRTMCPMNCHPTFCGMLVDVEDGRLTGIKGDKENPDSKGFLCLRGKATQEIIYNKKRLLYPLIRNDRGDESWRQTGWHEALELITNKMTEVGCESVGLLPGHGNLTNSYGVGVPWQLLERFANLYGCQCWLPTMVCWGLGAFGLGVTGILETNTKEDMGKNSDLVVLWGANLTSQPNTAPHIVKAKKRGARIITIDVRYTEAAAQSNEVYIVRPGSDAALALGIMNVIVTENLYDKNFVQTHTIGFEDLKKHLQKFTPSWAAVETGLKSSQIISLARAYATIKPAMIVLGGSSIHKGGNGWNAARAISCLPALTSNLGISGGGLGPRHGSSSHGRGTGNVSEVHMRPPGTYIPNQMSDIVSALQDSRVKVLMLLGSNLITSFPDSSSVVKGLDRCELVISYDVFMNETSRRFADVILPATTWLEELGCKATNTHVYLMEKILEPQEETKPMHELLRLIATRLEISNYYPWETQEKVIDEVLNHQSSSHITVSSLRSGEGFAPLKISPIGYPTHKFDTPSGKVEFFSQRAKNLGLSPLPVHDQTTKSQYPLKLCHGRTLVHFNSFYDFGQALPSLKKHNRNPGLWISESDADDRGIEHDQQLKVYNSQGTFLARALVTDRIPAGVVWIRSGWPGLNQLTSGDAVLPEDALNMFPFSVGQSSYGADVEIAPFSESNST